MNSKLLKTASKAKIWLGPLSIVAAVFLSPQAQAAITSSDYLCSIGSKQEHYVMHISGERYDMYFYPSSSSKTSYVSSSRGRYDIRFDTTATKTNPRPSNQQDVVEGRTGPGYIPGFTASWDYRHRLVFWVDFARTPARLDDDQRFDGYIMTQTEEGLAGITWKTGVPVGFRASKHHCI